MPDTRPAESERFDTSAGHLSMRLDGRPEVQFNFGRQPKQMTLAFLGTLAVQVSIVALVLYAGRAGLQQMGIIPEQPLTVVFLPQEGPGGGGGGGGNQMKEPPK
jgi:hypothetical protein